MKHRDPNTLDLLDWEPPHVSVGYSEDVTGRGSLDNQIARLISRALRDVKDNDGRSRSEIAAAITRELGRTVSEDLLNKWTSEASTQNRIPLDAFIALIRVTEATELLGFVPGLLGFAVVDKKYTEIIEMHLIEQQEQRIAAYKASLQAKWKGRQ